MNRHETTQQLDTIKSILTMTRKILFPTKNDGKKKRDKIFKQLRVTYLHNVKNQVALDVNALGRRLNEENKTRDKK